jgi:hypothetical protein
MNFPGDRHRIYVVPGQRWKALSASWGDLKTGLAAAAQLRLIVELIRSRGGGIADHESLLELNQAIETGRGGVFLDITPEQYSKLKRRDLGQSSSPFLLALACFPFH